MQSTTSTRGTLHTLRTLVLRHIIGNAFGNFNVSDVYLTRSNACICICENARVWFLEWYIFNLLLVAVIVALLYCYFLQIER